MARKQTKKATAAAAAAQNASLSAEQQLQQQVLHHYAKTVYFNDLWKSFLSNISGLVFLMSGFMIQRMNQSKQGIGFIGAFEGLSFIIAACTIFFVRRLVKPLLAFKAAFAFSLLQCLWFGHSYYRRVTKQDPEIGDLWVDQFPFGSMYFALCWLADRFMLRSHDLAKKTAEDVQDVLLKAN
ncbi:hypothetical protein Poli38472_002538 [Pythium oligandrum]|uniref:Uncharacterized protein n=1 Tax=Pythium oligandrum TaxID=41045 RepID=A0A8K1CJX4_PYTOL|nr:hypothetical protein Poli38472_002538 [Pythium oligandrum]|eukprot:TMW63597.1 hypothetical protein Poli38472_002538 [Pythium oligandrum]